VLGFNMRKHFRRLGIFLTGFILFFIVPIVFAFTGVGTLIVALVVLPVFLFYSDYGYTPWWSYYLVVPFVMASTSCAVEVTKNAWHIE